MSSRSITVLGGGISGLSAAFHLTRRFPAHSGVRIFILESSPRLGGWLQSEKVRVSDGAGHEADVVLESGPRTLRPVSKAVLELVHLLNLRSSLLTVPRHAPAARTRFVHIPGDNGLVAIPASLFALLRSPLAATLVLAVLKDVRLSSNAVLDASVPNDESVDSFLTRHFGPDFAQTFGSALVHGIYAANSRLLSVRSAFPVMCRLEARGKGSILRGAIRDMLASRLRDTPSSMESGSYQLGNVPELMKDTSVFSFQDGIQTLSDTLGTRLAESPNVEIVKGNGVVSLNKCANHQGFEAITESGKRLVSSHLISTIPLRQLHQLLSTSKDPSSLVLLPHLTANPSSSVTVVNLVFPPTEHPIHPDGFGYLIPRRSIDYPSPSLGMLGTVFDSCALPSQDTLVSYPPYSSRFTKVTVMLGGPYGPPTPAPSSPSFLPVLLETLRGHLGRAQALPEPCLVRVREHRDCIPTPTVGHVMRMKELASAVREAWGPTAAVVGAGVGGVSVGDCVEAGRRAAYSVEL